MKKNKSQKKPKNRKKKCKHENTTFRKEGACVGTIICEDCGYERDWIAY